MGSGGLLFWFGPLGFLRAGLSNSEQGGIGQSMRGWSAAFSPVKLDNLT